MTRIKSHSGMSMMEMMIVVVIIGLLAAIAVPNFGGAIKKMKFDNVGREMLSSLRYARAAAIGTQRPHGVFFDADSRKVLVFVDLVSPELGTYEMGDSVVKTDTIQVPLSSMNSTFANSTVIFNPDGTASQSGDILCYGASGYSSSSFSVSLVAGSGRARLERYD
ncbi:MAG: GspH/FimT family pseudopilin [candidate division Zixibacteria bacterium]|nr:GspH/FimT family pseudopilin [candidate division Zixibacteria bacterium]